MSPKADRTSPPSVELREFEGPLDLLWDEVRRQKVDLERVAMAPVVARFLDYVEHAAERNLRLDMDWLHMAATLIHWKSQSLLGPQGDAKPDSDPIRDSLVEQLLAHRKELAGDLDRRREAERTRFGRLAEPAPSPGEPPEPEDLSVWDLIQQARDLARWVEDQRRVRRHWEESFAIDPEGVTVEEMMGYLAGQLAAEGGTTEVTKLLRMQTSRERQACLFLGILQLAAEGKIELEQQESFGPIQASQIPQ